MYIGSQDKKVYALKPDGTLKWVAQTGAAVFSSPAIGADGTVYIGSRDSKIYAFGTYTATAVSKACMDNAQCAAKDFCLKNTGACYAQGVCSPIPEMCTMIYSPVCGCDGQTYSNSCVAQSRGVSVDHSGACQSQQSETCDGLDNNGNGQVDEGLTRSCSTACGTGTESCQTGHWIGCTAPQPQTYYYADADKDGYGDPSRSTQACSAPSGYVLDKSDCNDADKDVHPGAYEIPCNGKDDDCTGGDSCGSQGGSQGGSQVCTEDNPGASGTVDIEGTKGTIGKEVWIPVRIQYAPSEVKSFGFDVVFDTSVLEYSTFEKGTLVTNASYFDVKVFSPGRLRIGGVFVDQSIAKGASGSIVRLKFLVKGGLKNGCYSVGLESLVDGFAQFSKSGGCFCLTSQCSGDLNGDGQVTPSDALAAFKCYLGSDICPDCADVNQDGNVTPSDALCLFTAYLGQHSCLDN